MSDDHIRDALPPIGRRPVGPVNELAAKPGAPETPRWLASGPARLLVGTHILLLIQSALIAFSRIEPSAARTGVAALTAVSVIALVWAAADRLGSCSRKSGKDRHDA